nr:hypothetical protein [Paludisphaera mucosa]
MAALATAMAGCWGCGGEADPYQRFPVHGTVQLDGKPLKAGTINFVPGGPGASGTAEIVDGAFLLGVAEGLSPGGYRVEVYSSQPTGRKVPNPDDPGAQIDETLSLVDRRYNVASTLKAEIPAGGAKEPLSFDVTSPAPTSAKSKRR